MSDPTDPIRLSPMKPAGRKRKLGRGLEALMGDARREAPVQTDEARESEPTRDGNAAKAGGLTNIPVASIVPLIGQPRTHFDEDALNELAASISARGVIQPIIVTEDDNGRYRLVAGERRWRAAQKAHLHEIPALVRDLDQREVIALSLIENLQREDLGPMEEARAYQKLSDDEEMTQAEIAKLVDKSRSHVANLQRLLQLPEEVQRLVEDGSLSMGHARALIGHESATEFARQAVAKSLSVRQVEKMVKPAANDRGAPPPAQTGGGTDADIAAVQAHLEDFLGLSVKIKTDRDPRKGSVTVNYKTLDQLDLICQRLTGGEL